MDGVGTFVRRDGVSVQVQRGPMPLSIDAIQTIWSHPGLPPVGHTSAVYRLPCRSGGRQHSMAILFTLASDPQSKARQRRVSLDTTYPLTHSLAQRQLTHSTPRPRSLSTPRKYNSASCSQTPQILLRFATPINSTSSMPYRGAVCRSSHKNSRLQFTPSSNPLSRWISSNSQNHGIPHCTALAQK